MHLCLKYYFLSAPEEKRTSLDRDLRTYPSLNDVGEFEEAKKQRGCSSKNMEQVRQSEMKVLSKDWNNSNIHHMLNYELNAKHKAFQSSENQAQPQQPLNEEYELAKNPIGWQIPPKISLDTVDGFERHNLASNFIKKNTPVKTKLIPKLKSPKTQKFVWSEQLRQLSPWPKKNKCSLNPNSESFIKTSKIKILSLVSPKKENKNSINQIKKTPFRNVAIQTSDLDLLQCHSSKNQYKDNTSHQSPPGSYHSPIQSSQINCPSSIQSQNTSPSAEKGFGKYFDFTRVVHSPRKALRSSHRKLEFVRKENSFKNDEFDSIQELAEGKKTYRSFNTDLNQDVCISKLSCILSDIRTKLEESDEKAIRMFSVSKN